MKKTINNKVKVVMVMIMVIFTAIFTPLSSFQAQTYNEFSATPTIPTNQIDKTKTYFDLAVLPNQTQEIEVMINNAGSEEMIANIDLFSSLTGNNGGLIYTQTGQKDTSLEHPITDYATVKTPQVVVPANSSEKATIQLQFNDETFEGVSLGGIVVTATTATDTTNNNTNPIQLQNEVAYVIGLKLSMDQTIGDANLNLLETKAALIDYRTSVTAVLQNDQPVIMKAAKITGNIYEKNGTKSLSSVNLDNVDIAPNTNFNVVYDWNNFQITEGKYRIAMRAEYLDQVWEWNEEFVVGSEVQAVNDGAFEINSAYPLWMIITGSLIAILLLVTAIILFILWKKRKNEE